VETIQISYDVPVEPAVDVLVIGGGSSGIAAATAAARGGARTVLVERYGFLGGTSTAGMVGPFMTSYSADGTEQVIAGIFQEMVDRMVALGGAIDPGETEAGSAHAGFIEYGHAHVTPFHVEALKLAALEMTAEAGVRHRFHTWFVDTLTERLDARRSTLNAQAPSPNVHRPAPEHLNTRTPEHPRVVTGAVVLDKGGLRALPARVVIDTSADGDVSVRAGAEYRVGRADGKMMPATMFFRVGGIDDARLAAWMEEHRKLHAGERLFECLVQQAKAEGRWSIPREYINLYREPRAGEYRVNTTRLHDIDGTNPDDLSRAELEGRRQVAQVVRFLRDYGPGCEKAQLLETGAQIGIRETRHILGEYVLTGEDVLQGASFPDAICRCAYPIDIHDPTGTRGTLLGPQEHGRNWYEIPYRCLVPLGVENLLVAGRCLSASHEGAASARVIPPCYATGQAAGAAAALALELGFTPREVPADTLRERLRAAGAIV
jgi:glycine/D-amino acid oxidase-like deaminating enzyme